MRYARCCGTRTLSGTGWFLYRFGTEHQPEHKAFPGNNTIQLQRAMSGYNFDNRSPLEAWSWCWLASFAFVVGLYLVPARLRRLPRSDPAQVCWCCHARACARYWLYLRCCLRLSRAPCVSRRPFPIPGFDLLSSMYERKPGCGCSAHWFVTWGKCPSKSWSGEIYTRHKRNDRWLELLEVTVQRSQASHTS